MQKIKQLLVAAEGHLYAFLDTQVPVLHTAWQATASALVVSLFAAHSTADVKAALIAAGAVFLAALKSAYLNKRA